MSHNDKSTGRGALAEFLGFVCIAALGIAPSVGCGDTQNGCQSAADCDDGNDCTEDVCGFVGGGCIHRPAADGTECAFGELPGLCMSVVCEEDLCDGVECNDDSECTEDACDPADGTCSNTPLPDGAICEAGACEGGECRSITSVFPCSEQGIRDAIVAGGGPHAFSCDGPTTVETTAEIVVDNDVILDGLGELEVDGKNDHRVLFISVGVAVELRRLGVTNGAAGSPGGGGIYNTGDLTMTSGTVSQSSASDGGGILTSGPLTLIRGRVSENTAEDDGGGISNAGYTSPDRRRYLVTLIGTTVSGNASGGKGGGIDNGGRLTLTESTVSGNTSGGDGGGIYGGELTLANSTVSGNTCGGDGGGIYGGKGTVTSSTVAQNSASRGASISGGSLFMTNTLVDGDCSGTIGTQGLFNIESPGDTCGFWPGSVPAEDLKLGPLRDNGGPTETHALLPGSVAIDVIPEAVCVDANDEPLTEDQRGEPRDTMCDVGAFEVQP